MAASVQALVACGGSVKDPADRSPSTGGMPSASGGASAADPKPTSVPVGEAPGAVGPAVPEGSGAFFWRHGLGNWFVSSSDGGVRDAEGEELDGVKAWSANGGAGTTVDLWAQLDHPSGVALDLSGYSGISFEARLTSSGQRVSVAFGADGDFSAASSVSPRQQKAVTSAWGSYEILFADAGQDTSRVSSIDFITGDSTEPLELSIRNLALLCESSCP